MVVAVSVPGGMKKRRVVKLSTRKHLYGPNTTTTRASPRRN